VSNEPCVSGSRSICVILRELVMGKGLCTFKETDFTRAVKAARKAGLEIAGVRVSREGDIVILAGKPRETSQAETANPWDEVLDRATNEKRAS
jgi:hypothetical protein